MPSPMVETIREIPLIIERECPMESEDTGFPFDDDEHQTDSPFRSRLDDLAARHPEFAQQLNFGSFPFRSRHRNTNPDPFSQHRFGNSPSVDRTFGFERFGFPFDEESKRNDEESERPEQEQRPYYQRYPKYYPQTEEDNKKEGEASEIKEPERGRKKQNVQQSNTVDLGQVQEQEFVDARNQRSMSAPPPNSRPARYVSSINIPVNQDQPVRETPQSTSSQPQERVIPIHVEGRDEPILPKQHNTRNPHFTQRTPPNFPEYFQRDQPFQNEWFPRGFKQQAPPPQNSERRGSPQPRGRSPQPQTQPPQQKQPEMQEKTESHPAPTKPDPIDVIKLIQKDVSELMAQVDQFNGKPKDKQYLYLDEMLTRNLIKLDNIDTQGQENIRQARKEAIKCIEKCISILESKALSNADDKKMESEESNVEQKMEVEEKQEQIESMDVESREKTEEVMESEVQQEKSEMKDESEKKLENEDGKKSENDEKKIESESQEVGDKNEEKNDEKDKKK